MTHPLHALVVDDHPVNLRYLEVLLNRDGHRVHCATNGELAVQAAQQQVFELVLMDLHMPVMDGETAIRHIRALPAPHANPVIIVVTAEGAQTARQRVLDAGADGFLEKPIDPGSLRSAIERSSQRAGALQPGPGLFSVRLGGVEVPVLDVQRLAELRAAIPESALRDLLVELLQGPESGMHMLLRALERGEPGPAAAAAHKLKGSCMMMGLRLLQEAAAEAETLLRAAPAPASVQIQAMREPLREKAALTWAALNLD